METVRNALLKSVIGTLIAALALSLGFPPAVFFAATASSGTPAPEEVAIFTDVPKDSLYFPHIQRMAERYFLTGYAGNGTLARTFGPDSPITRAEIAKIAAWIRTAETKGALWGTITDEFAAAKKMLGALGIYYKCDGSICAAIGGIAFTDVKNKPDECKTSATCQPWFTQYVNFGVDTGYIKGYPPRVPGEARTFEPYESILRLHALKMAMVDDFDVRDIGDDARFKALEAKAVANSSFTPKCLDGAGNLIRRDSGGATLEGANMLRIALLADRLDLFGAHCEALSGLRTYKSRADFLLGPVTRKEAARYFALTTSYVPIVPDPVADATIGSREENEGGIASLPYTPPAYVPPKPADEKVLVKDPPMPTKPGTPALPNDPAKPLAAEIQAARPTPGKDPAQETVATTPTTDSKTDPKTTKPTIQKQTAIVCPSSSMKTAESRVLSICTGHDTGCQSVAANTTLCLTSPTARGPASARKYYVDAYLPERWPDLTYAYPLYHVNCDLMAGSESEKACADAGWKLKPKILATLAEQPAKPTSDAKNPYWEGTKQIGFGGLDAAIGIFEVASGIAIATGGTATGIAAAPGIMGGAFLVGLGSNNIVSGGSGLISGFTNIYNGVTGKPAVDYTVNPISIGIDKATVPGSTGNTALHVAHVGVEILAPVGAVKGLKSLNEINKADDAIKATNAIAKEVGNLQKEDTLVKIIASAKEAKPAFDSSLVGLAKEFNGEAKLVALKTDSVEGYRRASEKILNDYAGDAKKIKDVLRGTIVFDKLSDLKACVAKITKDLSVVELKDYFRVPKPDGYRAIHFIIKNANGSLAEIQLHMRPIFEAKLAETSVYEIVRTLETKPLTPEIQKQLAELTIKSSAIFEEAWKIVNNLTQ